MYNKGETTGVDYVLDLFFESIEAGQDSLNDMIKQFPQYEDELREFAALAKIDELLPDRKYTEEEEQLLNARTISVVQNALYNTKQSDSRSAQNNRAAQRSKLKVVSGKRAHSGKAAKQVAQTKTYISRDLSRRHIARAVLSAEIVSRLWQERTFGRVKHQKVLHLCEHIGQMKEISGEYRRKAAGPLDNKLIYSVESELKKQNWFETYEKKSPTGKVVGHGYRPLQNAGSHRVYFERWWAQKSATIVELIELMRPWKTQRCEILSTVYAAWNDLLIWGKPVTDESILKEILENWHEGKKSIPVHRWRSEINWIREKGLVPTGFGKATATRSPSS